ncbi:hypothetical protein ACFZBM_34055 [Streptomyces lavendulae]|uniref:hypothetical protein n=1 Tax=Streptomyces lavendulae TaxID=1914 RepID=UPI0036E0E146
MKHELAGVDTFFIAADPALTHISSILVTAVKHQDRVPNGDVRGLLPVGESRSKGNA